MATLMTERKRSALTRGRLPRYTPYVIAVSAVIVAAALMSLIGFHVFGWAVLSAVLFAAANVTAAAVVEGRRKATDKMMTSLVVGAFLVALLPLVSVIWTVLVNGVPGLLTPGFLSTSMNGVTGAVDNASVNDGTPSLAVFTMHSWAPC